ncbi:unnamed protein product [Urochloa humidicola]
MRLRRAEGSGLAASSGQRRCPLHVAAPRRPSCRRPWQTICSSCAAIRLTHRNLPGAAPHRSPPMLMAGTEGSRISIKLEGDSV